MQTLDQNLTDLVRRNIISPAEARSKAKIPRKLPRLTGTHASPPEHTLAAQSCRRPEQLMKGILGLLRSKTLVNKPKDESTDSMLFLHRVRLPGRGRFHAGALGSPCGRSGRCGYPPAGAASCCKACGPKTKYMAHLDKDAVERMERFFEFASVPSNRDLIRQDEYGNFMVVLLTGTIAGTAFSPGVSNCAWQKPALATSSARCPCWTAASAFRPAPR